MFIFFRFKESFTQSGKTKPGVNFINIQRTAFTLVDPKSVKKIDDNLTVFLTLLGSASIKVVCRTMMKLSPGVEVCARLSYPTVR